MRRDWLWVLAKGLEALGLIVVLGGLVISVQAGMHDAGLESMKSEAYSLLAGGALFLLGFGIERAIGGRG